MGTCAKDRLRRTLDAGALDASRPAFARRQIEPAAESTANERQNRDDADNVVKAPASVLFRRFLGFPSSGDRSSVKFSVFCLFSASARRVSTGPIAEVSRSTQAFARRPLDFQRFQRARLAYLAHLLCSATLKSIYFARSASARRVSIGPIAEVSRSTQSFSRRPLNFQRFQRARLAYLAYFLYSATLKSIYFARSAFGASRFDRAIADLSRSTQASARQPLDFQRTQRARLAYLAHFLCSATLKSIYFARSAFGASRFDRPNRRRRPSTAASDC